MARRAVRHSFGLLAIFTAASLASACGGGSKKADSPSNSASATSPDARDAGASTSNEGGARGASIDATPKPQGRLPAEVIQKIIRAQFPSMAQCYAAGLARTPGLAGTVTVRFVIDVDGHVAEAAEATDAPTGASQFDSVAPTKPTGPTPRFPDAQVTSCVVAEFANLKFPKPQGGTIVVVYPAVFKAK